MLIKRILNPLRHRGIQVFLLLAVYFLIADLLPLTAHQGLYTLSLFIKDLLVWILPITVGFFIANAICSFMHHAPIFIVAIILFEAISNFSSVFYAFICGHVAADYLPPLQMSTIHSDFDALWRLPLIKPTWWSADKGTFAGVLLGCIAAISKTPALRQTIYQGKEVAQWVLTRVFARLIPLFVLGFVARMSQTHLLHQIGAHYGMLLIWLVIFLASYLVLLFLFGSGLSAEGTVKSIKNLLPAGGIAFLSGCSLSTMPWTIEGAAKNLQNPSLAKAIIPATTNIQQIGDCIVNTFLCFQIYRCFYGHCPDLMTWMSFSIIFVLARFATAAVLGGAIFIMLPIYEKYLSFNPEMIAIILAFNVLLDPLVTSSNVIANGALCRIFEKMWIPVLNASQSILARFR